MTSSGGGEGKTLGGARLLGAGVDAEIYEWGEGRVLRLLRAEQSSGRTVTREAAAMRAAAAGGAAVPLVHEVLTVEGRSGLVMDRIDGPPVLTAMIRRPWLTFALSRRIGEIHARLHEETAPTEVFSVHADIARRVERLGPADEWLKPWARAELGALPKDDTLLHGDLHPLNALMNAEGPQLIDWARVTAGPAEADVARTIVLAEVATPNGAHRALKWLPRPMRRRLFIHGYLDEYQKHRELDSALLNRWRLLRVIERLVEGPTYERETLRRLIRKSGGPRRI